MINGPFFLGIIFLLKDMMAHYKTFFESRFWFFICWYLIESIIPYEQDIKDLWQKNRPTTLKMQQYILLYTWGTFFTRVHQTHLVCFLPKNSSCDPETGFGHSSYSPHLALDNLDKSSSRQVCKKKIHCKFLIIALMVEMGIFKALTLFLQTLSILIPYDPYKTSTN